MRPENGTASGASAHVQRVELRVAPSEPDIPFVPEAELPGDVLGGRVAVDDERDQPPRTELFEREVARRRGGLGREAAAPKRSADRVADLELGRPLEVGSRRLPGLRVPDD